MNPRVNEVRYEDTYKLILTFTNGELKEFDVSPYLQYPVYEVLNDRSYCRKAKVLNGTVVWDALTDFDPDRLYLKSKRLLITK